MKLFQITYIHGPSEYIWSNSEEELNSISHKVKINSLEECSLQIYLNHINSGFWFRLDLDTWDDFRNIDSPHNDIEKYRCLFLKLADYDRVGLSQNNPHTLGRIEDLTTQIKNTYPQYNVLVSRPNGKVILINKL